MGLLEELDLRKHINIYVYSYIWGLPNFHNISIKMLWIFFKHPRLPTQVPKSLHCPQTCLSQNRPKTWSFLLKSVLKLELWNIKSVFSFKLLAFLQHDMTRCVFPFVGQPFNTSFVSKLLYAKFDQKENKGSFKSQNV